MGVYSVGIVGESFRNDDGSSRQAEIGRCRVGEPVTLEREPDNPHDPNCVKVVSERGIQIGNISREHPWICGRIDGGRSITATIEHIGRADNGKLGVVLSVQTSGEAEKAAPGEALAKAGQAMTETGCSIIQGCFGLGVAIVLLFIAWSVIFG